MNALMIRLCCVFLFVSLNNVTKIHERARPSKHARASQEKRAVIKIGWMDIQAHTHTLTHHYITNEHYEAILLIQILNSDGIIILQHDGYHHLLIITSTRQLLAGERNRKMSPCHNKNTLLSRICTSLSTVLISSCVVLLFSNRTVAFPASRLPSRTTNDCFRSCNSNSISNVRDDHSSSALFSGGLYTQQYRTTRRPALGRLHAAQDEFQRSLLAARIANDIKGTAVKEECHRQERVEKQIVLEKEKLEAAVKEVQQAAQNVTQSAKTLGGAVISNSTEVKEAVVDVSQSARSLGGAVIFNGLGIITRFLTTLLGSQEFRLVLPIHVPHMNI